MNNITVQRIEAALSNMLDRIITRRTVTEPVTEELIQLNNPFGYLLVPFEIWKASKFERSFVTSLGQTSFEEIAKIIAEGTGAYAERQHRETITLNSWKVERIATIISEQRESITTPNWDNEVNSISALNNPLTQNINTIFDLYVRRTNGQEEYYSMKTVKPNLDQTANAKIDMLKIKAAKPESQAYFALPFNPAGNNVYRTVHSIPYQLLNMEDTNCVLIGADFWNTLGADDNTYTELMEIFRRVGSVYSPRIRSEFLEA